VIYIAVLFFSSPSNGYVGAQYERPFYAKIGIGWFAYQRGYVANVELTRGAVHRSPESLQPVGLSALWASLKDCTLRRRRRCPQTRRQTLSH